MKKTSLVIISLALSVSAWAKFRVGIEESRYVYGTYFTIKNLKVGLQHSLYSEKMGFQRVGIFADYGQRFCENFNWEAGVFGATTWNGNYQVINAHASLDYTYRLLTIMGRFQPSYDSEIKYKSTYMAQVKAAINQTIDIKAAYTTIPEYRISEKRLRGGFEFNVAQLKVSPELSLSLEKATRFKNMRVLMSMSYDF